ncbi:transcriptional regulator [Limosilactobacillus reuteri]|uniref:transcriptional regulator n=1 Tax=Limosilactobacillus reuteri TaxID=1598 RepID=UPI0039962EE0
MAKSKSKTYTTSELAKLLGISVVSASRFIVKHNFKPVKTGNHNAKYYSSDVYQQMKDYYQNKAKSSIKQNHVTKDDIIEQLQLRIKEQSSTIELLKQQLNIKDKQIATATKIADQAQKLDLTTHNQKSLIPAEDSNHKSSTANKESQHGALWKLFH